jgi:hypothetical protein
MGRTRFIRAFLFALFLIPAGAAAAFAQSGDETPKAEVFAGYSLLSYDTGSFVNDRTAVHGGEVSATGNVNHWLGIEGDVSGHFRGGDAVFYATAGPRFTYRGAGKVEPYAHVLAGGAFGSGVNQFAMTVGGGVDVKVNDKVAIRVIQADYAPIFYHDGTVNNARISAGVVFRFGNR